MIKTAGIASLEAYDLKDVCPNFDWYDAIHKMSCLQKRIIVHSIIYYELNDSIISDAVFDKMCRELVELMESTPLDTCEKSKYWYCMYDFDGATGFDLYSRLTEKDKNILAYIARLALNIEKNEAENENYWRENAEEGEK